MNKQIKKVMSVVAIFIGLISLSAAGAEQTVQSTSPEVNEGPIVYRDLSYVPNGHERQKLDIFLPKEGKNLPLIIRIHGGAWLSGSKEGEWPGDYIRFGYAVARINYRLSQHAIFPAQIEDCKAAVRYLRANAQKYNLDPNRFGVWGASAGGHLVALLGTTGDINEFDVGENLTVSSRVQAVVDYFGPTDFLQMEAHRLPNGMVHNSPDSPESKLIGGPVQENREKAAKANPITYVTKDDPPFLIVHGNTDPLVPHHQSELLEAALKKAGVPVTFYTVKGGGHGGFKDPNVPRLTREFFEKNLKNKQ
ncbi:MAG: alpha/beta hydrolase [Sedimentisphaerales bacterium]